MTLVKQIFGTSVGRKQVVGLTSLVLCLFIVGHLIGNYYLLFGEAAFDGYAQKLYHLGYLLYMIEIGLVTAFVLHFTLAMSLALKNMSARQSRYAVAGSKGGATWFSRTMAITGTWILIFLILHLIHFKFAPRDHHYELYHIVDQFFASKAYVVYYVISVCCVGFHVMHGFQSAFQTLGIYRDDIKPGLEKLSVAFGVIVAVGYSVLPIFMTLTEAKP
ncbi:MAG: succinate dehydrogenase [Gemmatimonadetes bacterium]|nr:MAG: succinate dehydrogenase [Gemmatimonadota bacterium]